MTLLVVGSTAYDSIETPEGSRDDCLGGSATHFALAARFFTEVRLVSIVGQDFRQEDLALLEQHGIDTQGLEIATGKTFRWSGRYHADLNHRDTVACELNTFGDFRPRVPGTWSETPYLFLANGHPATQASVLDQVDRPSFVVADTMDLWIDTAREELLGLLGHIDGLILNDDEARQLSGETSVIRAAKQLLGLGPRLVIVKKGEHGSLLFSELFQFALPAYPTPRVVDPTGAGDSFAGGFMGSVAEAGRVSVWSLKKAMAMGTVTASLNVEAFGVERLDRCERSEIELRYEDFLEFVRF